MKIPVFQRIGLSDGIFAKLAAAAGKNAFGRFRKLLFSVHFAPNSG
ncbi:MAG: hypothetical protein AB7F96_10770 [Beijerinckiaceae bacterium]